MTRRVRFLAAVLLAVALLTLAACGGTTEGDGGDGAAGEPYRIGAVVSLTGTYAGLGVPAKQAIELEVERINADGGIDGHPIEVIFEDDVTDAAKAQAAAVRLIEQEDVLAIIGASGTGQTMAMRTDIERAQIPQVSMAGGSVITAELSKWVFQTPWPNRVVIPNVLKQMAAAGLTDVALIADSGAYGSDGRDIILAEAGAIGITIVADEAFNVGDSDMTAQLTSIRGKNPDAVLIWNAGKEAAIVAKNMRQLNMTQPVYGGSGIARKEFIEGAADAAEGVRFGTGKILIPEAYGEGSEQYDVATDFIDRYTAEYGVAPDIFAGHAYDAIWLIADALGRAEGDPTPAALRDALEATSGFVSVGGVFTYSAADHNGLSEDDMVLYEIENGAWKLVK